jgi:hypothetical protein
MMHQLGHWKAISMDAMFATNKEQDVILVISFVGCLYDL